MRQCWKGLWYTCAGSKSTYSPSRILLASARAGDLFCFMSSSQHRSAQIPQHHHMPKQPTKELTMMATQLLVVPRSMPITSPASAPFHRRAPKMVCVAAADAAPELDESAPVERALARPLRRLVASRRDILLRLKMCESDPLLSLSI